MKDKAQNKSRLKAAKDDWQELRSNKRAMRKRRNSSRGKAYHMPVYM